MPFNPVVWSEGSTSYSYSVFWTSSKWWTNNCCMETVFRKSIVTCQKSIKKFLWSSQSGWNNIIRIIKVHTCQVYFIIQTKGDINWWSGHDNIFQSFYIFIRQVIISNQFPHCHHRINSSDYSISFNYDIVSFYFNSNCLAIIYDNLLHFCIQANFSIPFLKKFSHICRKFIKITIWPEAPCHWWEHCPCCINSRSHVGRHSWEWSKSFHYLTEFWICNTKLVQ